MGVLKHPEHLPGYTTALDAWSSAPHIHIENFQLIMYKPCTSCSVSIYQPQNQSTTIVYVQKAR